MEKLPRSNFFDIFDMWRIIGDFRQIIFLIQIARTIWFRRDAIIRNKKAIEDGLLYSFVCGAGINFSTQFLPVFPTMISNVYNGQFGDLTNLPIYFQIPGLTFIFGVAIFLALIGLGMIYYSSKNIIRIIRRLPYHVLP